uniref:Oxidoreductase N-terminal domain-containing protein n=1 Tax=Phenylobacterium glaciei TaxID=2803784 RepID=A0A974P2Y9_9CAUL|nr:hypothetical protein JKL49_21385 [Phenylobacterium glaciei]
MTIARQIHLVRRPKGKPVQEDFALVEAPVADAADGEIQVTALLMSVDPYMRPRLDADQALDAPLLGGGIGRVTQSKIPSSRKATWSATARASARPSSPTAAASRF